MIIQLDEAKRTLGELRAKVEDLGNALRIDAMKGQIEQLEIKTSQPDFWGSPDSGAILQNVKNMKDKVGEFETLEKKVGDTLEMVDMALEEDDDSIVDEVLSEVNIITETEARMRLETLLTGEYDHSNAILSFHPGAGGTEAQDWASMLYRMITRWAERHQFNVKLNDWLDGDEAGLKAATITVEGQNAYGFLRSENGVHRLVRVSPFDAAGRRQTSFASIEVMPEFENLDDVVIRPEDIEVTAHRSSGAGGQHINKTSSAIRIVHKPTGIMVGCQTERSQLQNKEYAMRLLKAKLKEIQLTEHLEKVDDIRGNKTNIEWGSQIRSYVFMPYTLAKDARTGYEDSDINAVMDGDLDGFINAYLKKQANQA